MAARGSRECQTWGVTVREWGHEWGQCLSCCCDTSGEGAISRARAEGHLEMSSLASQNASLGWKGFKGHPVPPCAMGSSYPSLLHALSDLALDTSRIRSLKPLWVTSQEHWLFSLSAFLFPWRRGLLRSTWEEKCSRRDPRGSRSCKHLFKERFYLFIPPGELQ